MSSKRRNRQQFVKPDAPAGIPPAAVSAICRAIRPYDLAASIKRLAERARTPRDKRRVEKLMAKLRATLTMLRDTSAAGVVENTLSPTLERPPGAPRKRTDGY